MKFSFIEIVAFSAGATEGVLCPLERIQVLLQNAAYHRHFRNTAEAYSFVRSFGLTEFYRGLSLVVLRNGLSNALFFSLRGPLKHAINQLSSEEKVEEGLLAADVSEIKNIQQGFF